MSQALPYCRAAALPERTVQQRWLVEQLWGHGAVGIVGGAPKCCKSWMGLDMLLSVASGTPCLGRYAVHGAGNVLCYLAEDDAATVKNRLRSIAHSRGLILESLPIEVITAPALRLDLPADQRRLDETVRELTPRMLLLDPFVRLHRIDENDAGQVSGVLAFLRALQREHHVAVVVVHHARKNNTTVAAGQALRGSSDFHAWGDSNLYLRRTRDGLLMTVEHRAASAPAPVPLRLATGVDGDTPHLEVGTAPPDQCAHEDNLAGRVTNALAQVTAPISRTALRATLGVRNERLGDALTRLAAEGIIARVGDAWALAAPPVPVPHP